MATVFLGGGRITAALLAGLRLAGYRESIIVHDRNAHKLRALKKQFGIAMEADFARAVEQARLLIIAVRPGDVSNVLEMARAAIASRTGAKASRREIIACS